MPWVSSPAPPQLICLVEIHHPKPDDFELPVTLWSRRCSTKGWREFLLLQGLTAELLSEEAAWAGGVGGRQDLSLWDKSSHAGSWKLMATAGISHSRLILSSQEEGGVNHHV